MKLFKYSILSLFLLTFVVACKNDGKKATTAPTAEKAKTEANNAMAKGMAQKAKTSRGTSSKVYPANSVIKWTGSKKVGSSHTGKIFIRSGNLETEGMMVTGGSVVIDMNSITCTDLAPNDGGDKLVGHLKSEDFFDVGNHPTATFTITKVTTLRNDPKSNAMVYGNLSIKGISKEIGFKAMVINVDGAIMASTNDFTIDRTDFGIKYGSDKFFDNLKDQVINDEITLNIRLATN